MFGVVISWLAAPPSDHETNSYNLPLSVCCVGTTIRRMLPATEANVDGLVLGWPSNLSSKPGTFVASVRLVSCGSISTYVVR